MEPDPNRPRLPRGRPRLYERIPIPPKPERIRQGEEVEAALKSIGVDVAKVQLAPKFTDLLMMARDGLPGVLEAMRYSRNKLILDFLKIYDKHSDQLKAILPWEAWCIKGQIPIPQLLGEIILALREHSVNAIKIMAITYHPDTMWTRIQMGLTPEGSRERNAIDVAMGFLPTPRGTTIIGRYYESGNKPDAEISERKVDSIQAAPTPSAPPPPPPPMEEPRNKEDIEMENVFPDSSRTLRILND